MILAIVVMLVSTAVYSLSYVLQHKGTVASMGADAGEGGGVKRLMRHPVWLAGAVLFYVAGAIHLVALSLGSLAVVQPLLVTELIFIPPIAAVVSKIRVSRRDWLWILVVSASLAVFLAVAQPTEGNDTSTTMRWLVTLSAMLVIFGVCMLIGRRLGDTGRAAMYGAATGVINALYVVAAKGVFGGPPAPLLWVLLVLAVFGALGGVAFATFAFRSGPVTVSSAAMIVVNPLIATAAAMYLFDVQINDSPLELIIIAIAMVLVGFGIVKLSSSEAVHGEAEHADDEHPVAQPKAPLPE
jgi:drug/metabolite transporter (DMT)-like permease